MRHGKPSHVEQVDAAVIAAVGALADPDRVGAVGRCRDGEHRVLSQQWMVVARRQHEAAFIDDFDAGIEHLLIEPDPIDGDGNPFARGGPHRKTIDVFPLHNARDRAGGRRGDSRLRRRRRVVGFRLRGLRQTADPERAEFGQPTLRAEPQPMIAERTVGRNVNRRLGVRGVHTRQGDHRDSAILEPELLRIGELLAGECDLQITTAGAATRFDAVDREFRTGRPGSHECNGQRDRHQQAGDVGPPTCAVVIGPDAGTSQEHASPRLSAAGGRRVISSVRPADPHGPCRRRRSRRDGCPGPSVPCRRRFPGSDTRLSPDPRP